MTLTEWIGETRETFDQHPPLRAAKYAGGELLNGVGRRVGDRINYGTLHWDRGDWDVLVILDACRFDLFCEVANETEWIDSDKVEPHLSAASRSYEWLQRMSAEEYRDEMQETTLVTGNPATQRRFNQEHWYKIDEVTRRSWSKEHGTVLPRPVTDGAIHAHRNGAKRAIIWYMQPHRPFVPVEWSQGGDDSAWYQLRDGKLEYEKLWDAYRQNLKYVLKDVHLLLNNINGNVVISADHANALGEWGVFGHPHQSWVPATKRVPWVEFKAIDHRTYEPGPLPTPDVEIDTKSQLKALGYK